MTAADSHMIAIVIIACISVLMYCKFDSFLLNFLFRIGWRGILTVFHLQGICVSSEDIREDILLLEKIYKIFIRTNSSPKLMPNVYLSSNEKCQP
ncbi:hypothetical protein Y1Q_0019484 [Alligator mississippiensis]|uniref:Uncharacterized protein n=1 Tax=Alligator mississippiensis TaxID=8496 RepID=A0A151NMF0_ALLMI|nr:hypothetical protein Y1Q_0019484 [Alligator mississippiensis]